MHFTSSRDAQLYFGRLQYIVSNLHCLINEICVQYNRKEMKLLREIIITKNFMAPFLWEGFTCLDTAERHYEEIVYFLTLYL